MDRWKMITMVSLGFVMGIAYTTACGVGTGATADSGGAPPPGANALECSTWEVKHLGSLSSDEVETVSGWEPFAAWYNGTRLLGRRCLD